MKNCVISATFRVRTVNRSLVKALLLPRDIAILVILSVNQMHVPTLLVVQRLQPDTDFVTFIRDEAVKRYPTHLSGWDDRKQ